MSLRKFESLTPAGKRMRIARDVLAQLDSKKLIAEHNTYLHPLGLVDTTVGGEYSGAYIEKAKVTSVKDVMKSDLQCQACAMGALLACKVQYENGISVWDGEARAATEKSLSTYFSPEQLAAIECAFEGRNHSDYPRFDDGMKPTFIQEACKHGLAIKAVYFDADSRLRDVMHNIIAHRGTFVPTGKPTPAPKRGHNQHSKPKVAPPLTLQSFAAQVDAENAAGVELTPQLMFNRAWIGLKLQGFARCAIGESCVYSKLDGQHCAWGWVDPAGSKDRSGTVYSLAIKKVGVSSQLTHNSDDCHGETGTLGFARKLQRAHDDPASVVTGLGTDPASVEAALRAFAAKHNLTIPDVP